MGVQGRSRVTREVERPVESLLKKGQNSDEHRGPGEEGTDVRHFGDSTWCCS